MNRLEQAILDEDRGETRLARLQYERIVAEGVAAPAVLVETLIRLGILMQDDSEGSRARWIYERALALGEQALGPSHPLVARALHELGTFLVSQDLARGREMIDRSERIWRATPTPDELHIGLGRAWLHEYTHPHDVLDHFARAAALAAELLPVGRRDQREPLRLHASALWTRFRRREALAVHERKLALHERFLEHRFTVEAISDVAIGWRDVGDPRRGRAILERYLGRMRAELSPHHPTLGRLLRQWRIYLTNEKEPLELRLAVAEEELALREAGGRVLDDDALLMLAALAELYEEQGRLQPRMALLTSWWETSLATLDPTRRELPRLASVLATAWKKLKRSDEAVQVYRDLIAHREARLGNDHLAVAAAIQAMTGDLQWDHAEDVEPYARRGLAIRERVLGPTDEETLESLTVLAAVHQRLEAVELERGDVERRVAAWEQMLSPLRSDADSSGLYELARLENQRGGYAAANAVWERALTVAEARLGPEHATVATLLGRLAQQITWEYESPRLVEIPALYERVIEIRRRVEGENGRGVGEALTQLADHHFHYTKRWGEAEAARRRAHAVFVGGEDPSQLDWNHRGLARIHEAREEWALAQEELRKAAALWEEVPGADYNLGAALDELSQFHLRRGQRDEGVRLGDRAAALYERHDSGGYSAAQALERVGAALLEDGLAPEAEERFELALPAYEKMNGQGGDDALRLLQRLGDALAAQVRLDEAAECWARIVAYETRSDGEDAKVKVQLARYHADRGRPRAARKLLKEALERAAERQWDDKLTPLAAEARALLEQLDARRKKKPAKRPRST